MTKSTVGQWSTAAASNTDVGGIGLSDSMVPTSLDDAYREMMAQIRVDLYGAAAFSGALYGLTLSNASDATNDIDIASGICIDGTNARWLKNASTLTKQLDASWSVGTNAGGLDTGSIANTTYHIWLIMRSDTGVVDALFSASASSPTMPANYDYKRRIGSVIRESGALVAFTQVGDMFRRAPVADRSSTSAVSSGLLALSVPAGISVFPLVSFNMSTAAANAVVSNALGSASVGSANITVQTVVSDAGSFGADVTLPPPIFLTNTSRQLYFAATITAGSIASNILTTLGWIDNRGRLY